MAARDRPWNSGLDPTSAGASREAVYKEHGLRRLATSVSLVFQETVMLKWPGLEPRLMPLDCLVPFVILVEV